MRLSGPTSPPAPSRRRPKPAQMGLRGGHEATVGQRTTGDQKAGTATDGPTTIPSGAKTVAGRTRMTAAGGRPSAGTPPSKGNRKVPEAAREPPVAPSTAPGESPGPRARRGPEGAVSARRRPQGTVWMGSPAGPPNRLKAAAAPCRRRRLSMASLPWGFGDVAVDPRRGIFDIGPVTERQQMRCAVGNDLESTRVGRHGPWRASGGATAVGRTLEKKPMALWQRLLGPSAATWAPITASAVCGLMWAGKNCLFSE